MGVLIVFGAALSREMRGTRQMDGCRLGDAEACANACYRGFALACETLDARCAGGDPAGCEGLKAVADARERRPWRF